MSKGYTIARIERRGETYEILVDPDKALKYRMGEKIPVSKIIVYDEVYKDAKKGIRAGEDALKKAFGTTDFMKIAEVILREGVVHVTAADRAGHGGSRGPDRPLQGCEGAGSQDHR